MSDPDPKWSRLSEALRKEGLGKPVDPSLRPPPGFATRIVARARVEARADATGLRLWRRWSLVGAGTALLACGALFLAKPTPPPQIIPVPTPAGDPSIAGRTRVLVWEGRLPLRGRCRRPPRVPVAADPGSGVSGLEVDLHLRDLGRGGIGAERHFLYGSGLRRVRPRLEKGTKR